MNDSMSMRIFLAELFWKYSFCWSCILAQVLVLFMLVSRANTSAKQLRRWVVYCHWENVCLASIVCCNVLPEMLIFPANITYFCHLQPFLLIGIFNSQNEVLPHYFIIIPSKCSEIFSQYSNCSNFISIVGNV